jgi:hypothetical protein
MSRQPDYDVVAKMVYVRSNKMFCAVQTWGAMFTVPRRERETTSQTRTSRVRQFLNYENTIHLGI